MCCVCVSFTNETYVIEENLYPRFYIISIHGVRLFCCHIHIFNSQCDLLLIFAQEKSRAIQSNILQRIFVSFCQFITVYIRTIPNTLTLYISIVINCCLLNYSFTIHINKNISSDLPIKMNFLNSSFKRMMFFT